MKKIYSKPEIIFEDFALSTNIAGNCEDKLHTPSNGVCGYTPEGYDGVIFTETITGCIEKHADGYNGICYHVPTETNNLFNS